MDQQSSHQEEPLPKYTSLSDNVYITVLDQLPDEVLLLILSYVPARDLDYCRCVSRLWKSLVDSPTIWRIKCQRLNRGDVLHVADMCQNTPWKRFYMAKLFSRNLVLNPCGSERFQYWDIINGGDGWAVERSRTELEDAESQTCFVTSFGWCEKQQIIDLVKEGLWEHFLDVHQPPICISDWYGGRHDCGCVYSLTVQLLAVNKITVIQEFAIRPDPIPQWNDEKYTQVSHEFRRYGPGVRYVKFMHKGKDSQFWSGRYGARITNSSVTIKYE
ncbi:F-box only protein 27-like [Rana temporaria]|uniref:F-box only protein 27-like n=1 Tax=Rana temporaria TaxID=8407 RepID=UPI001AADCACB|nr:F-box only protein 27-like [Rana temporaria]